MTDTQRTIRQSIASTLIAGMIAETLKTETKTITFKSVAK